MAIILHSLIVICFHFKLLRLGMVADFVSKALQPPEPNALESAIYMLKTLVGLCSEQSRDQYNSYNIYIISL